MAGEYISTLKINITSVQFKLKEIDQAKNHLLKELKHNNLMSEKHKKIVFKLR